MKTAVALPPYIEVDERGVPWIAGTRLKVAQLVMAQEANGFNAEELARQFEPLTLAQVHTALAYYHDHRAEIDEWIIGHDAWFRERLAEQAEDPRMERLRRAKDAS